MSEYSPLGSRRIFLRPYTYKRMCPLKIRLYSFLSAIILYITDSQEAWIIKYYVKTIIGCCIQSRATVSVCKIQSCTRNRADYCSEKSPLSCVLVGAHGDRAKCKCAPNANASAKAAKRRCIVRACDLIRWPTVLSPPRCATASDRRANRQEIICLAAPGLHRVWLAVDDRSLYTDRAAARVYTGIRHRLDIINVAEQ